jgi:hypothetical protein
VLNWPLGKANHPPVVTELVRWTGRRQLIFTATGVLLVETVGVAVAVGLSLGALPCPVGAHPATSKQRPTPSRGRRPALIAV